MSSSLPTNKYNVIYLDPPWQYNLRRNKKTRFGLGMSRYPGMTKKELLALPVGDIAAENCALFMWVTAPLCRKNYIPLQMMFELMDAWGFRYVTKAFTWIKVDAKQNPRYLTGYYTGSNSEDCYLGIKGKMPVVKRGIRQVITTQLSEHSEKPHETRLRIEQMYGDVPRIELFARKRFPGWDAWGNQVESDITMDVETEAMKEEKATLWT